MSNLKKSNYFYKLHLSTGFRNGKNKLCFLWRRNRILKYNSHEFQPSKAVPWQAVKSPSSYSAGPVAFSGQAMWDLWNTKVSLGQVFMWVLRFSPVTIIQPTLHTYLYTFLLREGRTGGAWEHSKKQCPFGNQGALARKVCSLFISCWTQGLRYTYLNLCLWCNYQCL
jgi:hypothetical protein